MNLETSSRLSRPSLILARRLALALACLSAAPLVLAQAAPSAKTLHDQGKYDAAASAGLNELLSEPWNHQLRFIVADSLERTGRISEAIAQFEAMEGTSMASAAAERLSLLRAARPASPPGQPAPMAGATQPMQRRQAAVAPVAALAGDAPLRSDAPAPIYQYDQMGSTPRQPLARERVRPRVAPLPAAAAPGRSPAAQRIVDLNAAEDYRGVANEGLALIGRERVDDEIRLMVANSLAWTGRLKDAERQYKILQRGAYANQATVGLANVYRWQGDDERTPAMYQSVLAAEPNNADAKEGLRLAERELAPRTTVTVGASKDSVDMRRQLATVTHRWRDASGKNLYEVETSGVNDRLEPVRAEQRDVTVRYTAKGLALQPSFELSAQAKPERTAFGSVRLKLGDTPSFIEAGRVNWGRLVSNARALDQRLTANHAALQLADTFSFGTFSGRADYYDVSDGNSVVTSAFQYTPVWRPLGSKLKPYVGIETRNARFNTPNYWSPQDGFGSIYAGLLAEWNATDWSFYANGLRGIRLYGEAGKSWSLSAGGKRWIDDELSVGLSLWSLSNVRDNSQYRDRSVTMSVEKLWK